MSVTLENVTPEDNPKVVTLVLNFDEPLSDNCSETKSSNSPRLILARLDIIIKKHNKIALETAG